MNRPSPPAQDSAAVALGQSVHRLARRLRKRAELHLTPSQMSVLTTVERHGPLRVGELTRLEQVGKSTMTRLVAKLEAAGYMRRWVDPEDGRSFLVALTGHAVDALEIAASRQHSYLMRQIDALDDAERDTLFAAVPVIDKLLEVRA
ncbi:MarR family winged helix-turn-helix transcriptional regulator [Mycobacterium neglectum]|jgi:DNA-binding MarR family transcriptional regulator|uniref:MarR family winged helix-turn-helix transcriptional regulator n=1 Tax=Mycobacterium neglectum TaxID=242737 RepID=UPI000BFEC854|nr:MarR family transcriptional regulator [Mycobacterium neglectum]